MYHYIMMRTQISLSAEDRRLLEAEAARTGRSMAELIRNAVSHTYGAKRDSTADIRAITNALGAWSDEEADGAEYVEHIRSGSRIATGMR